MIEPGGHVHILRGGTCYAALHSGSPATDDNELDPATNPGYLRPSWGPAGMLSDRTKVRFNQTALFRAGGQWADAIVAVSVYDAQVDGNRLAWLDKGIAAPSQGDRIPLAPGAFSFDVTPIATNEAEIIQFASPALATFTNANSFENKMFGTAEILLHTDKPTAHAEHELDLPWYRRQSVRGSARYRAGPSTLMEYDTAQVFNEVTGAAVDTVRWLSIGGRTEDVMYMRAPFNPGSVPVGQTISLLSGDLAFGFSM